MGHLPIRGSAIHSYHPYEYVQRFSHQVGIFGNNQVTGVVMDLRNACSLEKSHLVPEAVIVNHVDSPMPPSFSDSLRIVPSQNRTKKTTTNEWPLFDAKAFLASAPIEGFKVLEMDYQDLDGAMILALQKDENVVLLLTSSHLNGTAEQRAFFMALNEHRLTHPVIVHRIYTDADLDMVQIKSAADTGMLFLDGFGDGLSIAAPKLATADLVDLHFGVLQASRVRFSRTEYISCPGCGRTLFDLQTTTRKVRERTAHLKGLKIAIMGCIVNGIGEMADADYGYVGAGPGKVSLFKNRELVMKSLPETEAVERLIDLIRDSGDWMEPGS
jgi:(E)-4-hydroxy-3-methylbut-2-enyl-diphosphate synthase